MTADLPTGAGTAGSPEIAGNSEIVGSPETSASPVPGPVGAAGSGRLPTVGRVVGGVVFAGFAAQAAVVECFLVPLHAGRWPVPVAVPAAMLGNVLLARAMAWITGRRATALLPPVLWLVVVLVLAAPRPERDVVVPGTLTGQAFLFLGAIAGAFGAASTIAPGRRLRRPRPDAGVPGRRRG